MRKFTLTIIACLAALSMSAQWQQLSQKSANGSDIPARVNWTAACDGKLYAATTDGIWVSPSMQGGDWVAYGLQGREVLLLNFDVEKLAVINVESVDYNKDGVTKATAAQVYRLDGSSWTATAFNDGLHKGYNIVSGMVQVKDDAGRTVILVPTWGNGIWRSEDNGASFTQCPILSDPFDDALLVCKTVVGLFNFPGDNVIYGTDKASNNDNYVIYSSDFGKSWEFTWAGGLFNPWTFASHSVNGTKYFYYGGENGSGGYTVRRSADIRDEYGWEICATTDESGGYWHNRCMVGRDDTPIFAMLSIRGVFVYSDEDMTLSPLGDDLKVTNQEGATGDDAKISLTHLTLAGNDLYCSSRRDFIQKFDITTLGGVDNVMGESVKAPVVENGILKLAADADSRVSIYSLTGTELLNAPAAPEIGVDALAGGLYIVRYTANGANLAAKVIVK